MQSAGLPVISHLLQHTLRSLCADSQWVYSVFWRILPRNFPPPKWDTLAGPFDRSKANKRNWILVWEDGFCDFLACCTNGMMENRQAEDLCEEQPFIPTLQPELFFKMSHDVYNFGEGFMGKIAADNSHKWVYRNPAGHEIASVSLWQGSLDAHPRTWEAQFCAGIQTIAVVAVGEGLLQLGSTKKVYWKILCFYASMEELRDCRDSYVLLGMWPQIREDLNFVLSLQRKFNCLRSIPGVFAPYSTSELFQAGRNFTTVDNTSENAGKEDGSWQFTGDRMQVVADYLTDCNRSAVYRKPLFQNGTKFREGKLPVPSNGAMLDFRYGGECRAQFSTLKESKPSDRRGRDSPLSSAETSLCFRNPPPLLPYMSSLQALLSKLPPVTASESPGRIPYIPDNSPVRMDLCPLGSYNNSSIHPISSCIAPRTPQSSSQQAAATDSMGELSPQSHAVRYAPSCTTISAGNCVCGAQTCVGLSPAGIATVFWPSDELEVAYYV